MTAAAKRAHGRGQVRPRPRQLAHAQKKPAIVQPDPRRLDRIVRILEQEERPIEAVRRHVALAHRPADQPLNPEQLGLVRLQAQLRGKRNRADSKIERRADVAQRQGHLRLLAQRERTHPAVADRVSPRERGRERAAGADKVTHPAADPPEVQPRLADHLGRGPLRVLFVRHLLEHGGRPAQPVAVHEQLPERVQRRPAHRRRRSLALLNGSVEGLGRVLPAAQLLQAEPGIVLVNRTARLVALFLVHLQALLIALERLARTALETRAGPPAR